MRHYKLERDAFGQIVRMVWLGDTPPPPKPETKQERQERLYREQMTRRVT